MDEINVKSFTLRVIFA